MKSTTEAANRSVRPGAACPACDASLVPPSRPVCPACGTELGRFDPDPLARRPLSDEERREAKAERARIVRSVFVASAVFSFLLVVLFVLAKKA